MCGGEFEYLVISSVDYSNQVKSTQSLVFISPLFSRVDPNGPIVSNACMQSGPTTAQGKKKK